MDTIVKTGAATFFFFFAVIFIAIGIVAYMLAPRPKRKKLVGLVAFVLITVGYVLNLLFLPVKTPVGALLYFTMIMFELMMNISVLTFVELRNRILKLLIRIGFVIFVVELVALVITIYFFPQFFQ